MPANAATRQLVFSPETGPRADTLVVVFLRGGMDGLHAVPPHGDPHYRRQRASLAPADAGRPGGLLDLDGQFGLHPELAPLHPLYQQQRLALVHACGSPDTTLSHFEAMQTMERGVADGRTVASGWLGRHLASTHGSGASPLRAVAIGTMLPKSLHGGYGASAIRRLEDLRLPVPDTWEPQFGRALAAFYGEGDDLVRASGRQILDLLKRLERLGENPTSGGGGYPETEFGTGLRQVARLISAEVGLEAAALDLGGWDTHVAQDAGMTGLLRELGQGLRAFHDDLGPRMRRVLVLAMTEFGRRVRENGGLGTDHGRGSALFLLGGGVRGGRVYGEWPGLADHALDADGNLPVTTDYRAVLREVLLRRLGNPEPERVLPGFTAPPLSLFRAPV